MKVNVGDDIAIDSEKAGTPPREGTVLEVIEADWGTRYRIQWDDGHESTIHPLGGLIARRPIVNHESVYAAIRDLLTGKKAHLIEADLAAFERGHAAAMLGQVGQEVLR